MTDYFHGILTYLHDLNSLNKNVNISHFLIDIFNKHEYKERSLTDLKSALTRLIELKFIKENQTLYLNQTNPENIISYLKNNEINIILELTGFNYITNKIFQEKQIYINETTSKSVIITNKTIWISIAASVISALSTYGSYCIAKKTYQLEDKKDKTNIQIIQVQKQLKTLENHLYDLTHQNVLLKKEKDSLIHLLEYYKK